MIKRRIAAVRFVEGNDDRSSVLIQAVNLLLKEWDEVFGMYYLHWLIRTRSKGKRMKTKRKRKRKWRKKTMPTTIYPGRVV